MSSYYPPIVTGKFPTTSLRLLIALVLFILLDLPLIIFLVPAIMWWTLQVLILAAVLLLSPRFWIALLMMFALSLWVLVFLYEPNSPCAAFLAGTFLIPLWLGFFVAYRPYREVVTPTSAKE